MRPVQNGVRIQVQPAGILFIRTRRLVTTAMSVGDDLPTRVHLHTLERGTDLTTGRQASSESQRLVGHTLHEGLLMSVRPGTFTGSPDSQSDPTR